jgi:DNA-binding MarR family transcriptional regulator
VLRFVGKGETRATRGAERFGVSAPVLSRHIAELEEQGYVIRRQDPDDGRAQLVALSREGAEKLSHIEEQRTAALQEYLREWSQKDAEDTVALVAVLFIKERPLRRTVDIRLEAESGPAVCR